MTKLINVQFIKGQHGNSVRSTDKDFPASVNGSIVSSKTRLIGTLKSRMARFYPGRTFIFNFAS